MFDYIMKLAKTHSLSEGSFWGLGFRVSGFRGLRLRVGFGVLDLYGLAWHGLCDSPAGRNQPPNLSEIVIAKVVKETKLMTAGSWNDWKGVKEVFL